MLFLVFLECIDRVNAIKNAVTRLLHSIVSFSRFNYFNVSTAVYVIWIAASIASLAISSALLLIIHYVHRAYRVITAGTDSIKFLKLSHTHIWWNKENTLFCGYQKCGIQFTKWWVCIFSLIINEWVSFMQDWPQLLEKQKNLLFCCQSNCLFAIEGLYEHIMNDPECSERT